MTAKILRLFALALLVATAILWLATGRNRGWTKTSVPRTLHDEVTGLDGVVYERAFIPGVEFLAASTLLAGAIFGLSFFFRKKTSTQSMVPNA